MKPAMGQNKLYQNALLFMCSCFFATGQFYTLKIQSVRDAVEALFEIQ